MLKTVRGAVNIKYWWIPDGKTLMACRPLSVFPFFKCPPLPHFKSQLFKSENEQLHDYWIV
jgi:hypothetical protein